MRFESFSDSKNKLCHGPLLQCPCHSVKESYKWLVISGLELAFLREEAMPGFACGKMPSRFWNASGPSAERKSRYPAMLPLSFRDGIPRLSRGDDYFGKRNSASAPGALTRFASVNVPPCASAICRERARPIP